jgi:hypothetical protein
MIFDFNNFSQSNSKICNKCGVYGHDESWKTCTDANYKLDKNISISAKSTISSSSSYPPENKGINIIKSDVNITDTFLHVWTLGVKYTSTFWGSPEKIKSYVRYFGDTYTCIYMNILN